MNVRIIKGVAALALLGVVTVAVVSSVSAQQRRAARPPVKAAKAELTLEQRAAFDAEARRRLIRPGVDISDSTTRSRNEMRHLFKVDSPGEAVGRVAMRVRWQPCRGDLYEAHPGSDDDVAQLRVEVFGPDNPRCEGDPLAWKYGPPVNVVPNMPMEMVDIDIPVKPSPRPYRVRAGIVSPETGRWITTRGMEFLVK
jgi:hypothetical protein